VPRSTSEGGAVAVLTGRGRDRLLARHPWIYRADVLRGPADDASGGGPATVWLVDQRGKRLGWGTWAARAKIAVRVLDLLPERPGDPGGAGAGTAGTDAQSPPDLLALVAARLGVALRRRAEVARDRDAYRVVHGESDGLPGLFVDRYADAAVVQTTAVAMDAHEAQIAQLVRDLLGVRLVIARNDGSAREFEDLPRRSGVLLGDGPTEVTYRLGDNLLLADLLADSKTGGFLDQADNHARVAALAPDGASALDAFTFHGGFALALARRGGPVLANDEDERAAARTRANGERNRLANLTVSQANAFDLLRSLEAEGRRFDVVVVDPPALAKRKSEAGAADRAYKELVLRGLRLTETGGLTVACSCSGRMGRAQWDGIIAEAAADSRRQVQVLERLGAGRDHPELVGVPETGHLKCWVLRVVR
jgi:23S rRNA (cytosine1962-C5)-methyltransferase